MTAEEFFKDCIMSVEGVVLPKNKAGWEVVVYFKKTDKKVVVVSELEITPKGVKWFWCNWDEMYMPLIDNFKMTEDEATQFIKKMLEVDFVCFMPSIERYCRRHVTHSENEDDSLITKV